eukprot:6141597-Pyramimonas_sp.AAC.1
MCKRWRRMEATDRTDYLLAQHITYISCISMKEFVNPSHSLVIGFALELSNSCSPRRIGGICLTHMTQQVLSGDLITDVSLAYLAGKHCASGATATVLLGNCRQNVEAEILRLCDPHTINVCMQCRQGNLPPRWTSLGWTLLGIGCYFAHQVRTPNKWKVFRERLATEHLVLGHNKENLAYTLGDRIVQLRRLAAKSKCG